LIENSNSVVRSVKHYYDKFSRAAHFEEKYLEMTNETSGEYLTC